MASSRKSKRSKRASTDLAAHVAVNLKTFVRPGDRLLLGFSGGIDSVVLLDVLARLRKRLSFELAALHVNHQLSPNAAGWAKVCRAACAERDVACRVSKVEITRGNSVERAAREARYAAFRKSAADCIVLAHNADDQAETVLIQLLRGTGVRGMAAMPLRRDEGGARRDEGGGMSDEGRSRSILRPLLDVTRAEIEAYAKRRKLAWIEDESNTDTGYLRNWLRHEILPRVAVRVPAYRNVLGRAARHFGDAAALLDDLARADAGAAEATGRLAIAQLRALTPARRRNVLRFMLASRGWPMPDADRLDEGLRQALRARPDARLAVNLGACELRRHAGLLHLLPADERQEAAAEAIPWQGERSIACPALGGVLTLTPRRGAGLSLASIASQPVTIRARQGGERLQPHPDRPRRTVKNLLQEARIPAWERERLPFIYCGDTLACVPGVAIDHRFRAGPGERGLAPVWRLAPSR